MKPIRKFLARHVWLLFLLVAQMCILPVVLIWLYPFQFMALAMAVSIIAFVWGVFSFIGMITYHLYMKWSLE